MKSNHRITLLICSIGLVILQFIVYAPALNNAFVHYDDNTYVYQNANIKSLNAETVSGMFARPFFRSYTPLALLSHAVDYAVWKENPWGHHLTNLLLHSINVIFVFLLCAIILSRYSSRANKADRRGLFSFVNAASIAGACISATLYSLHPVRVESVAWVSDRKDLLLALFLLISVIAYLKYDEKRGTPAAAMWFMAALSTNILALLSKSIATVTPLLLLSLDAFMLHRSARREEWKKLLFEKTPFFVLSAGFSLLAVWAARGSIMSDIVAEMTTTQRILLPFYTLIFYPVKFLVPFGITPIYGPVGTGWMVGGALLALLILAGSLWQARRGHYAWLLALLCYALPLAPTMTGLSAGIQPWADRYTYIASVPLFLLVGAACSLLWERSMIRARSAIVVIAGVIALFFGIMDRAQIGFWKDSETLWRKVVHDEPTIPNGYDNLGVALAEKGDMEGALQMYKTAIRLQPNYSDPYYNAAVIFQSKNMRDSAVIYYAHAIVADSENVDAYINLANMYATEGDREGAIGLYRKAIAIKADNADAYYNLGCVAYQSGDRKTALDCFTHAIKLSPNYASAYFNMGVVYLAEQQQESALKSFLRAARLGSADAQKLLSRSGLEWN